jgi:dipeptide/tripeptide permease
MAIVAKIIGIIMLCVGILVLVSPVTAKLWLKSMSAGKLPSIAIILNFAIGVLLLISSGYCIISWIPYFLGVLAIAKGFVILVYGPKRFIMKSAVWLERRINLIRFSGIVSIGLAILLIMAV